MSRLLRRLHGVLRQTPGLRRLLRLAHTARQIPAAVRLATDPEQSRTLYPEALRKRPLERISDHLGYLFRHGEPDSRYYMYGLDRAGVSPDSVVEYPEFRRIRDRGHAAISPNGSNYDCVLEDKYLFGQLTASLGFPTPNTVALVERGQVEWVGERERRPLASVLERDIDGFCKPFAGISSRGAFALRVEGGQVEIDGQPATVDALRGRLTERYMVQERIRQHPDLARFHPSSINTLRVTTVLSEGRARVFRTLLRMGRGGSTFDGLAAGGIGVAVDLDTGRLERVGLARTGNEPGWHDRHPDTGAQFAGTTLPYFDEVKSVTCRIHEALPFFHTVGWDVAITPDGPLVIEGNHNWGATVHISIESGFKEHFLALYP